MWTPEVHLVLVGFLDSQVIKISSNHRSFRRTTASECIAILNRQAQMCTRHARAVTGQAAVAHVRLDRTGPHRIMAPKSKVLSTLQGGLGLAKANELPMVLVMGMTGAGKSHFINKLANRHVVEEGDDYDSCTSQDCALKLIFITGRRVGLQKSQY